MIICQCTGLTEHDILEAKARLLARNSHRFLTLSAVLKETGTKIKCGVCVPVLHRSILFPIDKKCSVSTTPQNRVHAKVELIVPE